MQSSTQWKKHGWWVEENRNKGGGWRKIWGLNTLCQLWKNKEYSKKYSVEKTSASTHISVSVFYKKCIIEVSIYLKKKLTRDFAKLKTHLNVLGFSGIPKILVNVMVIVYENSKLLISNHYWNHHSKQMNYSNFHLLLTSSYFSGLPITSLLLIPN